MEQRIPTLRERAASTKGRADPWLFVILAAGLSLRALALPLPGYAPDVAFWKSVATYAVTFGIQNVYGLETPLQPYPPLLMFVLWGLVSAYAALWPMAQDTPWLTALVKLPAVSGDLIASALLARFARKRGCSRRWAAALLALNPALIWISAYWGQVDILHGGFAAAAWWAVLARRPIAAGCLFACGALTKPQGLIVAPAGAALLVALCGWRGLARAASAGAVLAILAALPFAAAGYGGSLVRIYSGAPNLYPYLSLNAFNPWWIAVLPHAGDPNFPLVRDDGSLLGPLTPRLLGLIVFLAATVAVVFRCARLRPGAPSLESRAWRLLTLQWLAFFLLPTQVHERYLLPAIVSLAPAAVLEARWRWLFIPLSAAIWANLVYVLPGLSVIRTIGRALSGEGVLAAAFICLAAVLLARAEAREGQRR